MCDLQNIFNVKHHSFCSYVSIIFRHKLWLHCIFLSIQNLKKRPVRATYCTNTHSGLCHSGLYFWDDKLCFMASGKAVMHTLVYSTHSGSAGETPKPQQNGRRGSRNSQRAAVTLTKHTFVSFWHFHLLNGCTHSSGVSHSEGIKYTSALRIFVLT